MKKSILVFVVILLSQNLFSQIIGENTWKKKYGFEEGITQAIAIEASKVLQNNNSQVLLAFNSNSGTINTYKIDKKTGAILDLKFEKKMEKKGTWAVSYLRNETNKNHILISYADYGAAEIYEVNTDGSIGEKTWETNSYEKGISITVAMKNHVLLVKPNAGFAWVFNHKNGKIGKMTWQTTSWEKGIASGVSTGYFAAALTHSNGKFWIINCDKNTGIATVKYNTDTFSKGITTMASNPTGRTMLFIANPTTGHQWGLNTYINGVKIGTDTSGWEKGLTVQSLTSFQSKFGFSSANEGFLYVFKPEIGAAWVFKVSQKK
jgi:hypothetical protein